MIINGLGDGYDSLGTDIFDWANPDVINEESVALTGQNDPNATSLSPGQYLPQFSNSAVNTATGITNTVSNVASGVSSAVGMVLNNLGSIVPILAIGGLFLLLNRGKK